MVASEEEVAALKSEGRWCVTGLPNLEVWARRTIEECAISEREFGENLSRIGLLGRTYGFETLRHLFVNMISAGMPFAQVLDLLAPTTFAGQISGVRLYGDAKSAAEVGALARLGGL